MTARPLARERRHTQRFLEHAHTFSPVHLDTEVDMSAVRDHRANAKTRGDRYSWVTYLLHAAARVLAAHPEANAAITGRRWPKVASYPTVNVKLTLDKRLNGHRLVFSAVLPDCDTASLDDIQRDVDRLKDGDAATMPELRGARMLQKLPWPLGQLVFRLGARSLARRPAIMGTLAVTSLGHSAVDGFHSVGGTTITLGAGRVLDRPVVRDGAIVVAPVMRLNLTFDHRVIDGAEAAEILTELCSALEKFDAS